MQGRGAESWAGSPASTAPQDSRGVTRPLQMQEQPF